MMKIPKVKKIDWENVKETATRNLISSQIDMKLAKKMLEIAEKEIKKCPMDKSIKKEEEKNTNCAMV